MHHSFGLRPRCRRRDPGAGTCAAPRRAIGHRRSQQMEPLGGAPADTRLVWRGVLARRAASCSGTDRRDGRGRRPFSYVSARRDLLFALDSTGAHDGIMRPAAGKVHNHGCGLRYHPTRGSQRDRFRSKRRNCNIELSLNMVTRQLDCILAVGISIEG